MYKTYLEQNLQEHKIPYPKIPEIIAYAMEQCEFKEHPNLDEILETEKEAYEWIGSRW